MAKGKGIRAGGAFIELGVVSTVDKGLRKASASLKKFGSGFMKAGAAMTGAAVGALTAPVMLASQAQETMSKFNTVFGDSADEMNKWAKSNAAALGTSQQQMQMMAGSMQDFLVPMGLAPDMAADMTKQLSTLAVDLGSFNNMDTADTFRDLQAALAGSGEVMLKYGVIVNQANLNQELLNQNIDPKNATDAQKAYARMSLIMKGTTAAQGDAIRTQDSFANQLKRLKAGALDLGAAMGSGILDTLSGVMKQMNGALGMVKQFVDNNPGLVKGIGMAVLAVGGIGAALVAIGAAASLAGVALGGIATVLGVIMSPLGLVIGGIAALGVYVVKYTTWAGDAIEWFKGRFGPLVDTVKTAVGGIMAAFQSGDFAGAFAIAAETIELVWLDATMGIRKHWYDALNWMTDLTAGMTAGIGKMIGALARFMGAALDRYKAVYNNIYDSVLRLGEKLSGVRRIGGGGTADHFGAEFGGFEESLRGGLDAMETFGATMGDAARQRAEAIKAERAQRLENAKRRRDELMGPNGSIAEASKAAKEAAEQFDEAAPDKKKIENMLAGAGAGGGLAGAAATAGTFSAAGAMRMGMGANSPIVTIADESKKNRQANEAALKEAKKDKPARAGK